MMLQLQKLCSFCDFLMIILQALSKSGWVTTYLFLRTACMPASWQMALMSAQLMLSGRLTYCYKSQSSDMFIFAVTVWKMSLFCRLSGRGNQILRSSRPGLKRAGSIVSALLVAIMTLTFTFCQKPSIWFSSSMRTRCTSLSAPVCASYRLVAMASTSSMKIMLGALSLARRKTSLTMRGPSPRYFCTNSLEFTLMKAAVVWWATALAIMVFPVPGGPYMRTPLGGSMPICWQSSGQVRGSSTASLSSCFWMSSPPISAKETSGFSVICIIWMEASESGGMMSTTELEWRLRAIEEEGLSCSRSRVESTRTNMLDPELLLMRAWMSSTISMKCPRRRGMAWMRFSSSFERISSRRSFIWSSFMYSSWMVSSSSCFSSCFSFWYSSGSSSTCIQKYLNYYDQEPCWDLFIPTNSLKWLQFPGPGTSLVVQCERCASGNEILGSDFPWQLPLQAPGPGELSWTEMLGLSFKMGTPLLLNLLRTYLPFSFMESMLLQVPGPGTQLDLCYAFLPRIEYLTLLKVDFSSQLPGPGAQLYFIPARGPCSVVQLRPTPMWQPLW